MNIRTESSGAWLRALQSIAQIAARPTRLLPTIVDELRDSCGSSPALISKDKLVNYRELAEQASRYARWAIAQGVIKGDVVGLLMSNCPDYLMVWLGITQVGGTVALLNTNLVGGAMAHSIESVRPGHIIVGADLLQSFESAAYLLTIPVKIWLHGASGQFPRIDKDVESYSGASLAATEARPVTINDRALLIYTSGTTGLPKAANVSHRRVMQWSCWFAGLLNAGCADRMYDCLPLYHSVGGVVAPGALLVSGGSVVIREKFSAREFWEDVVNWNCTLFQYIGELCRYLVNTPEHPLERQHRLRLCCGNGLNADVWERFQSRFAIPRILEFYAATEGNVSLVNVEGKVGAIGRVPPFLAHRFSLALVRSDAATGEPQRNEGGFCVRCKIGEIGEAMGRIHGAGARIDAEFEGYTDKGESEKKIIRDVFEYGDAWLRTGDLMRVDESGYFYFVDRIGDTFRWKGENVSTSEVTTAINQFPGISEACVYGVTIPGIEGKAGMAVVVLEEGSLDLVQFYAHLARLLPAYARPLFLRIKDRIAVTTTFKHLKSDLVREGFDCSMSQDAVHFYDASQDAYVPLDEKLCQRIRAGEIRV